MPNFTSPRLRGGRIVVASMAAATALSLAPATSAHAADRDGRDGRDGTSQVHKKKHAKKDERRHHKRRDHDRRSESVKDDRKGKRSVSPREQMLDKAVDTALAQQGDPYSYGSAGPGAFDCSGLVYYAYRGAGFDNIPRTSSAQSGFARRISRDDMQRGDLMFFYGSGGVYHVAIYLGVEDGHRVMLHAPYGGRSVTKAAPWTDSWFAGTLR